MTIQGTINGGAIVLDRPAALPEGTRVEVLLKVVEATGNGKASSSLSQRLLKHAGTVPGLPTDMAKQHDHYVHGTPKR